jgi:hypothetical protein
MFMRPVPIWLAALTVVACSAGGTSFMPVKSRTQIYTDSTGWSIKVPPGWHAVRFSATKDGVTATGVQLSNVRLPLPSLVAGYPIQVNGRVLPKDGIGLIIATDPDPKLVRDVPVQRLPLPSPNGRYWNVGSAPAGTPYIETLWFSAHGKTFIACAKIGSQTTGRQLAVVDAVIRSLR